jgi:UDP-GlcNAc3NAcA epimerase
MKILTIIGARPQFIKASAVSRAFKNHKDISELIVHTGQHFDANMSDVFFEELDVPKPAYNLNIHSLNHGAMTGRMIEAIEAVILKETPQYVLVYGDTNSTLAGALAAKKLHIQLGHVEAGLRSYNMKMPEEINRLLTDRISDNLFCPTQTAINNLKQEGFENFASQIYITGDVMFDTALYFGKLADKKPNILNKLNLIDNNYILATIHRSENTDNFVRLSSIIAALNQLNEEIKIIIPLHPRTQQIIHTHNIQTRFKLIEPVGYLDMIRLIKNSSLVITDSGGLQKEAFFFSKNCVTLRDETEWVELVEYGFNQLAGAHTNNIIAAFETMRRKQNDFSVNLYGNGDAADKIAALINQAVKA